MRVRPCKGRALVAGRIGSGVCLVCWSFSLFVYFACGVACGKAKKQRRAGLGLRFEVCPKKIEATVFSKCNGGSTSWARQASQTETETERPSVLSRCAGKYRLLLSTLHLTHLQLHRGGTKEMKTSTLKKKTEQHRLTKDERRKQPDLILRIHANTTGGSARKRESGAQPSQASARVAHTRKTAVVRKTSQKRLQRSNPYLSAA